MSLGSVSVNNLNLHQGAPTEIERLFLFVGEAEAGEHQGLIHAIDSTSDLDALLGETDSSLKTQLMAARNNGNKNGYAYVLPLAAGADSQVAIDQALGTTSVEAVVVCDPMTTTENLEQFNTLALNAINQYQRRAFFLVAVSGLDVSTQSWAEYTLEKKALTDNVVADRVVPVPLLYPDFLGALAGRLANRSVSVADSPMRVATGALVGEYTTRPVDKNGTELTLAVLKDLHDNGRYTVPQWYADYEGVYTSDGYTLATVTSDYKLIENLRVADKAARRIYLLAVARVGDRKLNSTASSIAFNQTYFMKPLREMSHSVTFAGETLPGDIKPPTDEAISIVWPDKYTVQVFINLTPYNAPKSIEANILLDLSHEGSA